MSKCATPDCSNLRDQAKSEYCPSCRAAIHRSKKAAWARDRRKHAAVPVSDEQAMRDELSKLVPDTEPDISESAMKDLDAAHRQARMKLHADWARTHNSPLPAAVPVTSSQVPIEEIKRVVEEPVCSGPEFDALPSDERAKRYNERAKWLERVQKPKQPAAKSKVSEFDYLFESPRVKEPVDEVLEQLRGNSDALERVLFITHSGGRYERAPNDTLFPSSLHQKKDGSWWECVFGNQDAQIARGSVVHVVSISDIPAENAVLTADNQWLVPELRVPDWKRAFQPTHGLQIWADGTLAYLHRNERGEWFDKYNRGPIEVVEIEDAPGAECIVVTNPEGKHAWVNKNHYLSAEARIQELAKRMRISALDPEVRQEQNRNLLEHWKAELDILQNYRLVVPELVSVTAPPPEIKLPPIPEEPPLPPEPPKQEEPDPIQQDIDRSWAQISCLDMPAALDEEYQKAWEHSTGYISEEVSKRSHDALPRGTKIQKGARQ